MDGSTCWRWERSGQVIQQGTQMLQAVFVTVHQHDSLRWLRLAQGIMQVHVPHRSASTQKQQALARLELRGARMRQSVADVPAGGAHHHQAIIVQASDIHGHRRKGTMASKAQMPSISQRVEARLQQGRSGFTKQQDVIETLPLCMTPCEFANPIGRGEQLRRAGVGHYLHAEPLRCVAECVHQGIASCVMRYDRHPAFTLRL
jgi:hypothetical protein